MTRVRIDRPTTLSIHIVEFRPTRPLKEELVNWALHFFSFILKKMMLGKINIQIKILH